MPDWLLFSLNFELKNQRKVEISRVAQTDQTNWNTADRLVPGLSNLIWLARTMFDIYKYRNKHIFCLQSQPNSIEFVTKKKYLSQSILISDNKRQIFVRNFAIDLVKRHKSEFPFGMKNKFYFLLFDDIVVFMTAILVTNKAVITPLMLTYRYISAIQLYELITILIIFIRR